MVTSALIPANGVHITEGEYPKGFYVARYDADGYTSTPRWFPTIEQAQAYAAALAGVGIVNHSRTLVRT